MQGVIAAGGPETVAAGAAILEQGGNAVDAAVAAAFVSFIAEIGVVHWGGSGIAQIWSCFPAVVPEAAARPAALAATLALALVNRTRRQSPG